MSSKTDRLWQAYRKSVHLHRAIGKITKTQDCEQLPLSFAQQQLWILYELDPDSPHYNVSKAYNISGKLDVCALQRSLNEIVRRHEALRTSFHIVDGQPIQRIESLAKVELSQIDLKEQYRNTDNLEELNDELSDVEQILHLSQQPFKLDKAPCFRPTLICLGEEKYVLLLVLHHIIFDGVSLGVLWKELTTLYNAFVKGETPSLDELAIQYKDFTTWQRQWLQGDILAEHLLYWKERLANAPSLLELPTDYPRPTTQSFRGAKQLIVVPQEVTGALKAIAEHQEVTLFMVLLSAFKAFLFRCSHQEDILVGTPIANRNRRELSPLIGFFVNTLVLRTTLSQNLTFLELLELVSIGVSEAYSYQSLPFEKLVEELVLERHSGYNPLFQVMFVWQNTPIQNMQNLQLAEASVTPFDFDSAVSMFDLTLELEEVEGYLVGSFEYNTDLFHSSTIEQWGKSFCTLLEDIIKNPQCLIKNLSLVSTADFPTILCQERRVCQEPLSQIPVHRLFEAQVTKTPNALAVVSEEKSLSYQELNQRANKIADYLLKIGIGFEECIGLCVEKSPDAIAALLGIFKAGGVYIPLDPKSPTDRLTTILNDAQVKWVLTQENLELDLDIVWQATECQFIILELIEQENKSLSAENPASQARGENLAYVIYTSGSTGKPKGVMLQHNSLSNYVGFARTEFNLLPGDRVLQFASISFDTSLEEILPCLISGATLVLRHDSMLDSVPVFIENCRCLQISVLDLPTAYWHELVSRLEACPDSLGQDLRLVIIGGEAALPYYLEEWRKQVPNSVRLINTYGPTETTIVATYADLTQSEKAQSEQKAEFARIPIGIDVPNCQTYVLDDSMQLLPIGMIGELYIGGAGLARGYLGQPELTAEKFVYHSFSAFNQQRLYKTGDLVRRCFDGQLEFCGRKDNQVKIRGFRVELGEIESALAKHPSISDCAVKVWEVTANQNQLAAFIVLQANHTLDTENITAFLKRQLPEYMLPNSYTILDALPITTNGKINRKALPEPKQANLSSRFSTTLARTAVEHTLVQIWQSLLNVENIGINDNFFQLGGHSLLAGQVVARLSDIFQVNVSLRSFFNAPTIVGLNQSLMGTAGSQRRIEKICELVQKVRSLSDNAVAIWLNKRERLTITSSSIANFSGKSFGFTPSQSKLLDCLLLEAGLKSANASPILPTSAPCPSHLSFPQQRLWLLDRLMPGNSAYNLSIAFRLKGCLDFDALQQSIQFLGDRHAALRTYFIQVDQEPYQEVAIEVDFPLHYIDLSQIALAERQTEAYRHLHREAKHSFQLDKNPLLRVTVICLAAEEHFLLFCMHHIISDGWSIGILLEELELIYNSFQAGELCQLPSLPITYTDFSQWQRQHSNSIFNEQLLYWKEQLKDISPLELPTDFPRPTVQTYRGGSHKLKLNSSLTKQLYYLSQTEGCSMFMILLAAFNILLFHCTGHQDIVVGSPIAGRNRIELEGLVGFFVNTLVLRTQIAGNGSFLDLLTNVREVTLDAYAHQDFPFERLVEELNTKRDLSHTPIFQVFFNMLNVTGNQLALADLEVEQLALEYESKFDITLYATETEQEIEFLLVYNADLFLPKRIEAMLVQLNSILEWIAKNPSQPLQKYDDKSIKQKTYDYLPDPIKTLECCWQGAIPEQVAKWVRKTPNHLAVIDEQQQLSYQQVDFWSNRLAHYLASYGVSQEDVVAIYAQRSVSLIWILLGVLKAGSAFTILDPVYPVERLIKSLDLATPKIFLCMGDDKPLPELLSDFLINKQGDFITHLTIPSHSEDWENTIISKFPSTPLPINIKADDLAYVAFTSGSTGIPKAVLGNHQPVAHFLDWQRHQFQINTTDKFSLLSGLSHDPLLRDIFAPLTSGATLIIPDSKMIGSPGWLLEWMGKHEITISHLTPAMSQLLFDSSSNILKNQDFSKDLAFLPCLRYVFFGGDVLTNRHINQMKQLAPSANFINFYGTTETPQAVAWYPLPQTFNNDSKFSRAEISVEILTNSRNQERTIPIGKGVDGSQILILNQSYELTDIGEIGEIYVRSPYLTRGYLKETELNAERYLTNPFTRISKDRLYKTGDIGRYLPSGDVELLGRNDDQVKIRGYRLEIQEIIATLENHPAIHRAIVLTHNQDADDKHLVAYLIPVCEPPDIQQLHHYLSDKLPSYAIPKQFLFIKDVPLTPNGKINRNLLHSLLSEQNSEDEFCQFDNQVQHEVGKIWCQLLNRKTIHLNENFFELGGNSLLAVKMMALIEDKFSIKIPLIMIFQAQTIESFSTILSDKLQVASN